jgi:hypothetical protein
MKIKKISLQQFLPQSEASFIQLKPISDSLLRGFSVSSCPQHSLKVPFLLNHMYLFKSIYSTVNRISHVSYCDRFDGTSDMNAATQRIRRPSLGNDSVNNA